MKKACLLCDNSPLEVRTGCLILQNDLIIGEGWNETPQKHAEEMALDGTVAANASLENATVFVTRFPCESCAKKLVAAKISRLFFMSDHFSSGNAALPLFEAAGVPITQIPESVVWPRDEDSPQVV